MRFVPTLRVSALLAPLWISTSLVLGALCAGCGAGDGGVCQLDRDCASPLVCCGETASLRGVCRPVGAACVEAPDSGPPIDVGPLPDVPVLDGGPVDGGTAEDAPAPDDAGAADDAGADAPMSIDAGESDAGASDAGESDAGAESDAGPDAP